MFIRACVCVGVEGDNGFDVGVHVFRVCAVERYMLL